MLVAMRPMPRPGGDFEVLDAAGNKTGVWIDFKHYRIGAYEAYRRNGGETTDAERFKARPKKLERSAC